MRPIIVALLLALLLLRAQRAAEQEGQRKDIERAITSVQRRHGVGGRLPTGVL